MRSSLVLSAIALIMAAPLAIVTAQQVYLLQPSYVAQEWRLILSLLSALSWSGGLVLAFYLRARYGDTVPLLVTGGAGLAAFYVTYYLPIAELRPIFAFVYGPLTALYDMLLFERAMGCVGAEQRGKATLETLKVNMPLAIVQAQAALQAEKNKGKQLDKEKRLVISETHTRTVSALANNAMLMPQIATASVVPTPKPCPICGALCKNDHAKAAHMRWKHTQEEMSNDKR